MSKVLVLRSCMSDMTSYGGFVWPESGPVEAPDWEPTEECGNGLHGFLWGEGDVLLAYLSQKSKWLVVEVEASDIIHLGTKVKFPRGVVVFCGELSGAAEYIRQKGGDGKVIHGSKVSVGEFGAAITGYRGTSKSLSEGISIAGGSGKAESGVSGFSVSGGYGQSTTGKYGTAIVGTCGTAKAGDYGIVWMRSGSKAAVGIDGILVAAWIDINTGRQRISVAYAGENGIKPDTFYRFNLQTKSFDEVIENGQEES